MAAVFWLLLPVMVCFLGLIYYKVGYDFREIGRPGSGIGLQAVRHVQGRSRADPDFLRDFAC